MNPKNTELTTKQKQLIIFSIFTICNYVVNNFFYHYHNIVFLMLLKLQKS